VVGFQHAVVTVPDMAESLHFYRDLLGLQVTYTWDHDPETLSRLTGYHQPHARAAILECSDGTELELVEFQRPRGSDKAEKRWHDAGISFIAFKVNGIEALVERLKAAGVPFNGDVVHHTLEDGNVVKVVYCFAPEGTTVTFTEGTLPSPLRGGLGRTLPSPLGEG
jgi:catechol 2,3-dioxygenase-like lactoylglutathione lyase family enzyme